MPAVPDIPVVKSTTGKFAVFQRMRFKKSLLHLPSIAYLTVTERPQVFSESGLAPFEKCKFYIGDTLAGTLFAVAVEPHVEKSGHQVSLGLAAPTIDAVECSVDTDSLKTWAITEGTVGSVAAMILKPYNIPVKSIDDVKINPVYPIAINPGMTCWSLIEELLRVTQRLAYDGADGSLIISPVGTTRAGNGLTEGVNAERLTAHLSGERYSRVVVFAQAAFVTPTNAPILPLFAEAKDTGVPRNRLLMIPIDALGPDGKYPQQRADWQVAFQYGRSRQVQITVSGFRDRAGALWAVNTVVGIHAPSLKVSEDMVIAEVEFLLDDQEGSRTTLTCIPAAGLAPPPFLFRPPFAFSPGAGTGGAPGTTGPSPPPFKPTSSSEPIT